MLSVANKQWRVAGQIGDSYTDTDTRFVGGYTATIGLRTPDPGALTVWRVASQIGRQLETQSPRVTASLT